MLKLARQLRDGARATFRGIQLRQGLAALERSLRTGRQPPPALLEQLVHGWGNEAWCASALFLAAMLEWFPQTSDSIVECGSGLSTLLLATGALVAGRTVHSLEHDAEWASVIRQRMPERLRPGAAICHAPLRSYGDFDWYSFDPRSIAAPIGYVVCDGPPGSTRRGRYGLAPVLGNRLAPGCIILLDDTQRQAERTIVEQWCEELGTSVVNEGGTFTVLRVGEPRRGT